MKKENHLENLTPLSQLITYTLLVLSVLVLVYLDVRLFRGVTQEREQAEHLRSTITYVQNEVFLCEDKSAVRIGQGPEGDMLILPMQGGKYEIIDDREEAITKALSDAKDQKTVVLVTAKGRETRQKRGLEYIDVESDVDIVKRVLKTL